MVSILSDENFTFQVGAFLIPTAWLKRFSKALQF